MKKTYNKPKMKSVRLLAAESLMTVSGNASESVDLTNTTAVGTHALSNEESEHDIWGNDGSSMWN